MRLTEHFTLAEFTRTVNHPELQGQNDKEATTFLHNLLGVANELEKLRNYILRPVFITSGFRCDALNTAVGGSTSSQHRLGQAADFTVEGFQDLSGLTYMFNWCCRHLVYNQLILEDRTAENRKPWIHFALPLSPTLPPAMERLIYKNGVYTPAP